MGKRIESRSDVQKEIERYIIEKVSVKLGGINMVSNPRLVLGNDDRLFICPDFFSENGRIIGEIHTHEGRLKSAQQDKIASDVLKMILHDKMTGITFRKYIAVCGKEEYEQLKGASYLAEAIRQYEINLLFVEIPEDKRNRLREAVMKQDLRVSQSEDIHV